MFLRRYYNKDYNNLKNPLYNNKDNFILKIFKILVKKNMNNDSLKNINKENLEKSNNKEVLIVTDTGYSLWHSSDEIPITGVKASDVKPIKLKDDVFVGGTLYNKNDEYVTIFTDKMTDKRVRLDELEKSSFARRKLLIFREVNINPHRIKKILNPKEKIGIVIKTGISILKNSQITQAFISKTNSPSSTEPL